MYVKLTNSYKPKIWAIIPARGGSKGLPRKNIKPLCGIPLLGYSIWAANYTAMFDKIIVSTDDQEIADIATNFGADVPFLRPEHLSDDNASLIDAVIYTADKAALTYNSEPDFLIILYPTSPLRNPQTLGEFIHIATKRMYVLTARPFSHGCESDIRMSDKSKIDIAALPKELYMGLGYASSLFYMSSSARQSTDGEKQGEYSTRKMSRLVDFRPISHLFIIEDSAGWVDIDTEFDFLVAEQMILKGVWKWSQEIYQWSLMSRSVLEKASPTE